MTFSIVAFDEHTQSFAVGVITKHFAVGTSVPWIKGKVGAVATQANTNPLLGISILESLEKGSTAQEALNDAIKKDCLREERQCHVVDRYGNCAAWTGQENVPFASYLTGNAVSVAGNMLAGDHVLPAMLDGFREASKENLPLIWRIYRALEAGEVNGGDKRGPGQSCAIYICNHQPYPVWNLRVDHNESGTILQDLKRLIEEGEKPYVRTFYDNLPASFEAIAKA